MTSKSKRGFILVTVLGLMALISFLVVVTRVNVAAISQEVAYLHSRAERPALIRAALDLAAAKILSRLDTDAEGKPVQKKALTGTISYQGQGAKIEIDYRNLAALVDLNHAPLELLSAAIRMAGANKNDANKLAQRIRDWVDEEDPEEISAYSGSLNQKPKNAPMQSILELGQIPGISQKTALALTPFITTSSGLKGIHPDVVPLGYLLGFPGISPQTKDAIQKLIAGKKANKTRKQILEDPALRDITTDKESWAWEVKMAITPKNERFSTSVTATIGFIGGADGVGSDIRPYRILEYIGPLEKVSG